MKIGGRPTSACTRQYGMWNLASYSKNKFGTHYYTFSTFSIRINNCFIHELICIFIDYTYKILDIKRNYVTISHVLLIFHGIYCTCYTYVYYIILWMNEFRSLKKHICMFHILCELRTIYHQLLRLFGALSLSLSLYDMNY